MNLLFDRLREYLPGLTAAPAEVAAALTLAGVAVERVTTSGDGAAVLETDITSNRPDLLSYLGTAREIAARYRIDLRPPEATPVEDPAPAEDTVAIEVETPELCPRYSARVVRGVTVGPSPPWLVRVLDAAGLRAIHNVVDATNFVLLELGQPTHAFDLARLAGSRIVVRPARGGERLTTLDQVDRQLTTEDLVIADAERSVALAGIMGGAASEISLATRDVLIESAFFDPRSVRRSAARHGLKTEASIRFERRADPDATVFAASRVAGLIAEVAGGRVLAGVLDRHPPPPEPARVRLRLARLDRLLGHPVPPAETRRILAALGFRILGAAGDATEVEVEVPGFRQGDVTREIDLVEEVGRHFGYDRIPAILPPAELPPPGLTLGQRRERLLRHVLEGSGLSEAVTLSMVDPEREQRVALPGTRLVTITNPLSERLSAMRATVTGGLLEVVAHNLRRGAEEVAVYETARVFSPAGDGARPIESLHLGIAFTGPGLDERRVKGTLERIGEALQLGPLEVEPGDFPRTPAAVRWPAGGSGRIERIAPDLAAVFGLDRGTVIHTAEIAIEPALGHDPGPVVYRPFSRFPPATRDVSLFLGEGAVHGEVVAHIRAAREPLLESIQLTDHYVSPRDVSVTLRLTYRHPERTLETDEVQAAHGRILAVLAADQRLRLRLG